MAPVWEVINVATESFVPASPALASVLEAAFRDNGPPLGKSFVCLFVDGPSPTSTTSSTCGSGGSAPFAAPKLILSFDTAPMTMMESEADASRFVPPREIRRSEPLWYFYDDANTAQAFDAALSAQLEKAARTAVCSNNVTQFNFVMFKTVYVIDLAAMTQKNTESGRVRNLARRSGGVAPSLFTTAVPAVKTMGAPAAAAAAIAVAAAPAATYKSAGTHHNLQQGHSGGGGAAVIVAPVPLSHSGAGYGTTSASVVGGDLNKGDGEKTEDENDDADNVKGGGNNNTTDGGDEDTLKMVIDAAFALYEDSTEAALKAMMEDNTTPNTNTADANNKKKSTVLQLLTARDEDGNTALHVAAMHGNLKITELFCKAWAFVADYSPLQKINVSAASATKAIAIGAAGSGDRDGISIRDARGHTALHCACLDAASDVEATEAIVRLLIAAGVDVAAVDDNDGLGEGGEGCTALQNAALVGDDVIVADLIAAARKCDPSSSSSSSSPPSSAAAAPTSSTYVPASVLAKAASSATATAAATSSSSVVAAGPRCSMTFKQFINYGGPEGAGGSTALHCAAMEGHEAIVRMLVEGCGADMSIVNSDGHTPFDAASEMGHEEVAAYIRKMMKRGTMHSGKK